MTTKTRAALPRVQLDGGGLPDVPRFSHSRISLVYIEDGAPVFNVDPVSGDPVTVVLIWPGDSLGGCLPERANEARAARWIVRPTAWADLAELQSIGFDLTNCDLILRPSPTGLRPTPTWYRMPDVFDIDFEPIIDRGISTLIGTLEPRNNRENLEL